MNQKEKLQNQKQKLEALSEKIKQFTNTNPEMHQELKLMYDEVIETLARLDTNQYICYR